MKRTILSALAASILAATSLGAAQAAPVAVQPLHNSQVESVDWKHGKASVKRKVVHRHGMTKHVVKRHGVNRHVVKQRWARGNHVPDWRQHAIYDYRRYHLARPASGESWVRVNNEFLLVAISTGIIVGITN